MTTGESNTRDAVRRSDMELNDRQFLSAPGEILKRFVIKVFWADEDDNIRYCVMRIVQTHTLGFLIMLALPKLSHR